MQRSYPPSGNETGPEYESDHCFIATAAYGTPLAEEINALRRFRNNEMEPNLVGKHFVTLYYDVSPPIARAIARSERMKAFVRLSLKPIIRSLQSRARAGRN